MFLIIFLSIQIAVCVEPVLSVRGWICVTSKTMSWCLVTFISHKNETMINKDVHVTALCHTILKHMFQCQVTHHISFHPRTSPVLKSSGLQKLAGTSANTQSWDWAGILQKYVGNNKALTYKLIVFSQRFTILTRGKCRIQ